MKHIHKLLEKLAFNYLLKRHYQITKPMLYFSGNNSRFYVSGSYWQPKEDK